MNGRNTTLTRLVCCCTILTLATSALADFLGVTTVIKIDPDTDLLCAQGKGDFVPGRLTVCNLFAAFDDPDDRFLQTGNADLQVFNGQVPDVFFQHPANFSGSTPPVCDLILAFPDLICDTSVTIGLECAPSPPAQDNTFTDGDFDPFEFNFNGHITGGWFISGGFIWQGNAGNNPDLQVLFLQSSVARGLSLSGDISIFWLDFDIGEVISELDVAVECAATCGSCPTDTDGDGDTDAFDLALLLGNWGQAPLASPCLDADGDGIIGASDLAVLLGAWGPCPE